MRINNVAKPDVKLALWARVDKQAAEAAGATGSFLIEYLLRGSRKLQKLAKTPSFVSAEGDLINFEVAPCDFDALMSALAEHGVLVDVDLGGVMAAGERFTLSPLAGDATAT